jgi:hypothetical protein
MSRRVGFCLFILAVLVAAPAARAGGPQGGAVQDGSGLVSTGGKFRYVAVGAGNFTTLEVVRTHGGRVRNWTAYPGSFGIPTVTVNGTAGGLSADGRTLVLSSTSVGSPSKFLVVDTRTLRPKNQIALKGNFAFDALSPDGSRLYLIQHKSVNDLSHYVVRGYDLRSDRLLPGFVADKTQQDWVMQGYPMTRTTSANGRWVYTLYQNPGGYPFVHALDTVQGVAHCIGLPWTGDQTPLFELALTVGDGGKTLAVHWKNGRPWLAVNTANWRITHVQPGSFPWRWSLAGAGGGMLLMLALGAFAFSTRRSAEDRREAVPLAL